MSVWLAILLLAAESAPSAEARRYILDPDESRVLIHVGTAGLFGFLGHEHDVEAARFSGEVRWDPAAPEDSSVEITFDASAIQVLDPDLDEDDRAQVQQDMETKVLAIEKYPEIRFVSRRFSFEEAEEEGRLRGTVTGALTLRGETETIDVPIAVSWSEERLEAEGEMRLRGSRFGVPQVSAGAGTVKTSDRLAIRYRLVGRRP